MKTVNTFTANIYVGTREGYDGRIHSCKEAEYILQEYCDEKKFCVTLTETVFIYTDGNEKGFIIGLINYPRFPLTSMEITVKAIEIANIFMREFNQLRVSVVCSDKTYMLEQE